MVSAGAVAFLPLLVLGLALKNAYDFIDGLTKVDNFEDFNKLAFKASIDAILDIISAVFAAQLVLHAVKATEVELLMLWTSIMASLISSSSK